MEESEAVIFLPSDAFGQFNVKEMSEMDFALQSATPTAIKDPACHIILFYEPSSTDPLILDIWAEIARNVGGPVIAAVNTSARREIMAAFFKTQANLDDPFNAYTGFSYPSILAYRQRWPQAFYNGELSYDALVGWIKTLACKPGYRELDAYNNANFIGPGPLAYFGETREDIVGQSGDEKEEEDEETAPPPTEEELERARISNLDSGMGFGDDSRFNESNNPNRSTSQAQDPGFI